MCILVLINSAPVCAPGAPSEERTRCCLLERNALTQRRACVCFKRRFLSALTSGLFARVGGGSTLRRWNLIYNLVEARRRMLICRAGTRFAA